MPAYCDFWRRPSAPYGRRHKTKLSPVGAARHSYPSAAIRGFPGFVARFGARHPGAFLAAPKILKTLSFGEDSASFTIFALIPAISVDTGLAES